MSTFNQLILINLTKNKKLKEKKTEMTQLNKNKNDKTKDVEST
jgi:hypothetical protein